MLTYIIRRVLYALPILLGINIIIFLLFFYVNTPDDMARAHLGNKHITQQAIEDWKAYHGYNLPLFYNNTYKFPYNLTQSLFFNKSLKLFVFNFGFSDSGSNIGNDIKSRMWPSLAIAIPALIFGLLLNIIFALFMVFFKNTYIDTLSLVFCVVLLSISSLFYIIGGQFLLSKYLHLFPISGYIPGLEAIKFIILPVLVSIVTGLGAGSLWYRTIILEQINKEYVMTARAKGLSEGRILFRHVLKNAMLPILTNVIVILPTLFMGSLILESFFGIPGLGSYTVDALQQQDFAIIHSMVFLGSVLYIIGLILTDISYVIVDPRVELY